MISLQCLISKGIFVTKFPLQLAALSTIQYIYPVTTPPKCVIVLTLSLLENQTYPSLYKTADLIILKDIFKCVSFQMGPFPPRCFTGQVHTRNLCISRATKCQQTEPRLCFYLKLRPTCLSEFWPYCSFPSSSESISCSNVTDDIEEMKCGWTERK